ncbi:MAG: hypothetical protein M3O00_18810, partial [Pseudomonadota bacterium]|nr:hypothetical protein [Pseudomonadota bacterium]
IVEHRSAIMLENRERQVNRADFGSGRTQPASSVRDEVAEPALINPQTSLPLVDVSPNGTLFHAVDTLSPGL